MACILSHHSVSYYVCFLETAHSSLFIYMGLVVSCKLSLQFFGNIYCFHLIKEKYMPMVEKLKNTGKYKNEFKSLIIPSPRDNHC